MVGPESGREVAGDRGECELDYNLIVMCFIPRSNSCLLACVQFIGRNRLDAENFNPLDRFAIYPYKLQLLLFGDC